jgi:hypothetical protein
MAATTIGTEILKRVRASQFQGTKKLKMAWRKESSRDCPRGLNSGYTTADLHFVGRWPDEFELKPTSDVITHPVLYPGRATDRTS